MNRHEDEYMAIQIKYGKGSKQAESFDGRAQIRLCLFSVTL
jgi:hypothetical protein